MVNFEMDLLSAKVGRLALEDPSVISIPDILGYQHTIVTPLVSGVAVVSLFNLALNHSRAARNFSTTLAFILTNRLMVGPCFRVILAFEGVSLIHRSEQSSLFVVLECCLLKEKV